MKSISESIIGRKGSHRLTWNMNKAMYTDPEDIIAMLLQGRYILFNGDGEYRLSKKPLNPRELSDIGRTYRSIFNDTIEVPIDTYAFQEEALEILKSEGYNLIVQLTRHPDWYIAAVL